MIGSCNPVVAELLFLNKAYFTESTDETFLTFEDENEQSELEADMERVTNYDKR